jgi:hypothetical protein
VSSVLSVVKPASQIVGADPRSAYGVAGAVTVAEIGRPSGIPIWRRDMRRPPMLAKNAT